MKSRLPITNVASGRGADLSSGSPNYNATSALNNMLSISLSSLNWSLSLIFFFLLYLGGTPYPTISNHKLFGALKAGYRMEKPQMCSDEMWAFLLYHSVLFMSDNWHMPLFFSGMNSCDSAGKKIRLKELHSLSSKNTLNGWCYSIARIWIWLARTIVMHPFMTLTVT